MNPLRLLNRPKRLAGLSALAVLGLVLAACSPGALTLVGKDTAGNTVVISMTCKNNSAPGNCSGHIIGVLSGKAFTATSGSGGFTDTTAAFPSWSDCTAAPCSPKAGGWMQGTGVYNGVPQTYTLDSAFDNDPGTSDSFHFYLVSPVYKEVQVDCANCVEIKMLPGTNAPSHPLP